MKVIPLSILGAVTLAIIYLLFMDIKLVQRKLSLNIKYIPILKSSLYAHKTNFPGKFFWTNFLFKSNKVLFAVPWLLRE